MAKETTVAREGRITGLRTRNAVSNIPEGEREATNWWINRARGADTVERAQSLARTVEKIFNNGEVSYASAKAVIDAAGERVRELKNLKSNYYG